jgi:hypothetical protein
LSNRSQKNTAIMLHHASFNARHPKSAAQILAEMADAVVVRAPTPPFPEDSWFVCYGDAGGSFFEVIPWGRVLDPDSPFGVGRDDEMRSRSGAHVLVSTTKSVEQLQVIAGREGWRLQLVDARLFKVVKVWVENAVLIEFLPTEFSAAYLATFDSAGLATLDGKLRALESPAQK